MPAEAVGGIGMCGTGEDRSQSEAAEGHAACEPEQIGVRQEQPRQRRETEHGDEAVAGVGGRGAESGDQSRFRAGRQRPPNYQDPDRADRSGDGETEQETPDSHRQLLH